MVQEQDRTPNDVLAEDIASTLISEGLVPEDKKEQLLSKLKSGTAKQDDWNLWIDLATNPKTPKEDSDE